MRLRRSSSCRRARRPAAPSRARSTAGEQLAVGQRVRPGELRARAALLVLGRSRRPATSHQAMFARQRERREPCFGVVEDRERIAHHAVLTSSLAAKPPSLPAGNPRPRLRTQPTCTRLVASLAHERCSIRTMPWSWYTDPAVLQLEQERIFRRSWQYVGHARTSVPEPGSFVATRVGGRPGRRSSATRRTRCARFLNVCRHRGSLVCEGSGRRETIQCPYHAWTYGARRQPDHRPARRTRRAGSTRRSSASSRCRSSTWGPLVFVSPDPDAAPLEDFLDGIPERIADAGHRRSTRSASSSARSRSSPATGRSAPRTSSSATTARSRTPGSRRSWTCRRTRTCSRRTPAACRSTARRAPSRAARTTRRARSSAASSTSSSRARSLNVMPGRPNLSIGPIVPRDAETHVPLPRLLRRGRTPTRPWIEESLAFDAQVGAEDRVLVERVQAGVRAGLDRGRAPAPASRSSSSRTSSASSSTRSPDDATGSEISPVG